MKATLNKLQRAQLIDCLKAGKTMKVNPRAKGGERKQTEDTPLFKKEEQTKLF